MNKVLKITSMIVILLMVLMSTSYAVTINVNEEEMSEVLSINSELLKNEVINTDLILVQDNITVSNIVNGNVYIIGEVVNISSDTIDGDVFVAANDVTISSNVNGNVYVFANNLNVDGSMKDIYAFAENINLKENTTCRDFKTFATNINIDGIINRDLYVAAGKINLSQTGKVGGVLSTTNENLNNKENVNAIKIIEDITANLKQSENQIETFVETAAKSVNIFFFISAEVTGLIIILLIVLFSSKKTMNNRDLIEHGLMDTVYGLLYFAIAIAIIIGLIFTLIGIPISILLLLLLWFIFWKITIPVASVQVSKTILKQENKSKVLVWIMAFIIFTLIQLSSFIPQIGGLIKALISLYGFGYIFRSIIRKNKSEDSNQQIIENN